MRTVKGFRSGTGQIPPYTEHLEGYNKPSQSSVSRKIIKKKYCINLYDFIRDQLVRVENSHSYKIEYIEYFSIQLRLEQLIFF